MEIFKKNAGFEMNMKFEKNVGMIDRGVRIAIGFLIIGYGVTRLAVPWNVVSFLVGFAILMTGAVGTCTLYSLLGITTAEETKKKAEAPKKRKKAK